MVDREKHRHGNDGKEQHQVVQWIIRSAGEVQHQRKSDSDQRCGQQVDGDQSTQPLPEELQDGLRLPIETIGEHAVIAVHEHGLGDVLSAVDKIHVQQGKGQGIQHHPVGLGGYFRAEIDHDHCGHENDADTEGKIAGGSGQQLAMPFHEDFVQIAVPAFAAGDFDGAVQLFLLEVIDIRLFDRITVAKEYAVVLQQFLINTAVIWKAPDVDPAEDSSDNDGNHGSVKQGFADDDSRQRRSVSEADQYEDDNPEPRSRFACVIDFLPVFPGSI